jgi:hypothetical protein
MNASKCLRSINTSFAVCEAGSIIGQLKETTRAPFVVHVAPCECAVLEPEESGQRFTSRRSICLHSKFGAAADRMPKSLFTILYDEHSLLIYAKELKSDVHLRDGVGIL